MTPIAGLPKPRAPVNLEEVLAAACDGVAGITPAQFRGLLSDEDLADIEHGRIHPKTLAAYARSFGEGIRSGRIVVPGGGCKAQGFGVGRAALYSYRKAAGIQHTS